MKELYRLSGVAERRRPISIVLSLLSSIESTHFIVGLRLSYFQCHNISIRYTRNQILTRKKYSKQHHTTSKTVQ